MDSTMLLIVDNLMAKINKLIEIVALQQQFINEIWHGI
tara:strand:- start:382 stop:495 length:114 start_codon:yes stop_codon:yes gene_type:complete